MSIAVSDVIVIVAAVAPVGFLWWFFFGPKTARRAHLVGGVQEVDVTVKGGYSPSVIRVTEGVPLRSRFDRQESGDCTSRVVFADFGASKTLPAFGTAILEFTPDKAGEFDFACGMNMIHGTLVVGRADGSTTEGDAGGREVASAVGVGPSTEATVVTERVEFGVSNMSCASCVVNIESVIGELAGVDNVEVSFGTERATVDFDPSQIAATEIQAAAGNAGYRLTPRTRRGASDTEDTEAAERRAEIADLSRRVVLGAALAAPVVVVMAMDLFGARLGAGVHGEPVVQQRIAVLHGQPRR